jgi:thymidine kinase
MLAFIYSTINAGKTANLILSAHACNERGINNLIFVPSVASGRDGFNKVSSRIGIHQDAISVTENDNIYEMVHKMLIDKSTKLPIQVVFVDEAQFLTLNQVVQLTQIADSLDIQVHAYGLRSDFKGEPFEASKYLLSWADKIEEVKTWAENSHTAKKAIMNIKVDENGNRISDGDSVSVGFGYKAVTRNEFNIAKNWKKLSSNTEQ